MGPEVLRLVCSDTVVKIPGATTSDLPAPPWGQACKLMFLMSGTHSSHSPSVSPSDSPTRQWGLPFMSRNPRLGCPIGGLNAAFSQEQVFLCSLHFPLNYRHHGTQVLTQLLFFHSFLVVCVSYSVGGTGVLLPVFPVNFQRELFYRRWIFDVFMGEVSSIFSYSAILIQGPLSGFF